MKRQKQHKQTISPTREATRRDLIPDLFAQMLDRDWTKKTCARREKNRVVKHWNIRLNNRRLFLRLYLPRIGNNIRRTRRRENKGERTRELDTRVTYTHAQVAQVSWMAHCLFVCLVLVVFFEHAKNVQCYAMNNDLSFSINQKPCKHDKLIVTRRQVY